MPTTVGAMTTLSSRRRRPPLVATLTCAAVALLVTACGGSADGGGVASVSGAGGSSAAASAAPQADTEQQLLDYVGCLREQGLDVPDPEVDADGNVVINPGAGAGPGAAGFDQEAFTAAQQVCGEVPDGVLGGADADDSELQDGALQFAQCLREQGLDVADPDFTGGAGPGADGGPFGDLDMDDPAVQAALEQCQDLLGAAGPGTGA